MWIPGIVIRAHLPPHKFQDYHSSWKLDAWDVDNMLHEHVSWPTHLITQSQFTTQERILLPWIFTRHTLQHIRSPFPQISDFFHMLPTATSTASTLYLRRYTIYIYIYSIKVPATLFWPIIPACWLPITKALSTPSGSWIPSSRRRTGQEDQNRPPINTDSSQSNDSRTGILGPWTSVNVSCHFNERLLSNIMPATRHSMILILSSPYLVSFTQVIY